MKKVFIVTACAFTLCLASCATNEAPAAETQIETPQIDETSQQETDADTEADATAESDAAAQAAQSEEQTEDFPEPEAFEEPEIITLEPADDPVPEEPVPAVEEVEKEEPPVIEPQPAAEPEPAPASETKEASPQTETEQTPEVTASDTTTDGVIDITDDDSDSGEEYNETEKEIIPSRSVTMKKFEYLDVTYPGTGWIFMGLTDNSKDIAYFGRKLGTKDTKFTLQARNAGTKIVHFYKNDALSGNYLDDYMEITVLAENGSNKTHIQAPEYKLPVQKKEVKKQQPVQQEEEAAPQPEQAPQTTQTTQPAQQTKPAQPAKAAQTTQPAKKTEPQQPAKVEQPAAQTEPATPAPEQPKDYSILLQEAQVLYNEQAYPAALAKINQFFEFAADKRDEGLYLKGQILEAKSNVRDIKGAIEAYSSLTKNYPASKLWDSANKRIIYLKRFYLEVR